MNASTKVTCTKGSKLSPPEATFSIAMAATKSTLSAIADKNCAISKATIPRDIN